MSNDNDFNVFSVGRITPAGEIDWFIQQGTGFSCAIRSQQIILRDYWIFVPEKDLIFFANVSAMNDYIASNSYELPLGQRQNLL